MRPLEATPAGVREIAADGTPHSAKAAGVELRKLTQAFYERLLQADVAHEELSQLQGALRYYFLSQSASADSDGALSPLLGLV